MARIIYKKGFENQNELECIEGIEIELLNKQKALIYPKYADLPLLDFEQIDNWKAKFMTAITALNVKDSTSTTDELLVIDSPAAKFVRQFRSDSYGLFNLPTLLAAMEIIHHREDINRLAETIDDAELLREGVNISSCSRYSQDNGWIVYGRYSFNYVGGLDEHYTCVPLVLYRKP